MSHPALEDHRAAGPSGGVIIASAKWSEGLSGEEAGLASLMTLLDEARLSFERDKSRTRQCLEHALNLLTRDSTPADQSVGGLAKWQISRVTAYIQDKISEPIRVTDLAAAACLSPGHFSRRFRASFGEKPLAYLTRKRVEFAQGLMLNASLPLAILALDAGFCDQAHFTRVFKRTTGASPRAWLRTHSAGPLLLTAS